LAYLARKVEARHAPTGTIQPAPGKDIQARAEYMDEQVIEALDELERGTLDLEAVQRLIGN
jgi:hypothetical protein